MEAPYILCSIGHSNECVLKNGVRSCLLGIVIGFSPSHYTVDESAGSVNFTVEIFNGILESDLLVEFYTERDSTEGM